MSSGSLVQIVADAVEIVALAIYDIFHNSEHQRNQCLFYKVVEFTSIENCLLELQM